MRAYTYNRGAGRIEFGIIYGAIALLTLCAVRIPGITAYLPSCALKGLAGISCPTCGSTRAVLHLAHGDVLAALAFNPLVATCFLVLSPFFLYSLVTLVPGLPRIGLVFSEGEKGALRIGVVMLVLMNWIYLIFAL